MDYKKLPAGNRFGRALFVIAAVCVVNVIPAVAQDVVIEWPTRTLTGSPTKVYNTIVVNIRVNNANTLLYDYNIDVAATPRSTDDFGKIADLVTKPVGAAAAAAVPTACQIALHGAENAATDLQTLLTAKDTPVNPDQGNGKYTSVTVDKTITYWTVTIQPKDDLLKQAYAALWTELSKVPSSCTPADSSEAKKFFEDTYTPLRAYADSFEHRLTTVHQVVVPVTLSPENDYKVTVTELYRGQATGGGTQTFSFSPESDILTLSAGALLTEVQNRTYASGALPGQTGNFLLVSGNSPIRPILVAQLNYRIPKLSWDSFGFALSSGAALQFTGGNSGVSNVGFFGGVSAHLWRRFYVTPGIHVGEFADFPPGFTAPNQSIPSGFGQLNPNKRWTARFAIGITYKTVDFTKFTSGSSKK